MLSLLQHYTILYVEDEPAIQANITEYLASYFKAVYVASDGQEGLACYQKHHPDVLLLDINVPYLSGLELAQTIRQEDKSIKILMLTGITETEKLLQATELKLTKYLLKPLSPKAFKSTLKLLVAELMENPRDFVPLGEGMVWDKEREQLLHEGERVILSEKEQKLLRLFISKQAEVIGFETIMVALWEDAFDREISIDSVKNQVSNLRKKLPKGTVINVYGQGYRLL